VVRGFVRRRVRGLGDDVASIRWLGVVVQGETQLNEQFRTARSSQSLAHSCDVVFRRAR